MGCRHFLLIFSRISRLLAKQVEVDGRKLALPEDLAGVLFLNIPSYMGGVDLWAGGDLPATAGPFAPQSFSDARLEACARLTLVEVKHVLQAAVCNVVTLSVMACSICKQEHSQMSCALLHVCA